MSRIAGIVSRQNNSKHGSLLQAMLNRERLGDDWAVEFETFNEGALGQCGKGRTTFAKNEGLVVVLDGSIYNQAKLGAFKSGAELLCRLYAQHGFEKTIEKLNGDFSIALYDLNSHTLWLARDRFGIKPLYYLSKPEFFAFASRPSALLTLPGVQKDVNKQYVALFAASHYRYFDHQPERSPYTEISQLPAAHILCFQNGKIKKTAYWSLRNLPDFSESEDTLAERYRDLILDAVSLRLKSTNRPAFTLSGGLDSSSVLASAVKMSGQKQHIFSTVYSDKTYDETEEIRSMLDTTAQKWYTVKVDKPDVFKLVDEMIGLHDQPVATATWLAHYVLCQEVKKAGFDGLFGGLGGDELNAGEYEYYFFYFADLRREGKEDELKREVELWAKYHNHPIYQKNFQVMESGLKEMVDLNVPGKCLAYEKRMKKYSASLNRDYYDLNQFIPVMEGPFSSYLKNRAYHDLTRETAPACLRAEDRQSLAFGITHVLPFFDHRLAEFMFRVPGQLKIKDGITKHLLRKAMIGILPEETRTRIKKTGWNAPAHLWFSKDSRDQLFDLIHSDKFRQRSIYNVSEVKRLLKEHCDIVNSGRNEENHMMFLWQLVNLELWFRKCID